MGSDPWAPKGKSYDPNHPKTKPPDHQTAPLKGDPNKDPKEGAKKRNKKRKSKLDRNC